MPRRTILCSGTYRLAATLLVLGVLLSSPGLAWAQSVIWVAKTVSSLPRTEEELAEAHAQSKAASLQVPVGDPLQLPDFKGHTEYDITVRKDGAAVTKKLPYDYCRLGAISYGMQLTADDQANLPSVSKGRIMTKVDGNYISVQMRVQREPETGAIYLYYKPFAAVGAYGESTTQEFAPLIEDSVRNARGLGLWVKSGTPASAEAFRTFVGISLDTLSNADPAGGPDQLAPHYELFFVRARVEGDQVALHTFTTNEYRTRLNYLPPYQDPATREDCNVVSTIYFTEYTAAKQSPSAKAARQIDIHARSSFAMEELDAYAAAEGWTGDALDNLTELLDAIIDGKL